MANNFEKLLGAYAAQIQDLETVFLELLVLTRLNNAAGVQLGRIGVLLGLERGSLSDDDYRARLRVRIKTNQASGTGPEIIEIASGILATDQTVELKEFFPGAIVIVIEDALPIGIDVLATEVFDARAAGINTVIEYTLADDDDTFTFAAGDSVEFSDRQGFSDDAAATGGVWAFAQEA